MKEILTLYQEQEIKNLLEGILLSPREWVTRHEYTIWYGDFQCRYWYFSEATPTTLLLYLNDNFCLILLQKL
jgi:hypothetical protein